MRQSKDDSPGGSTRPEASTTPPGPGVVTWGQPKAKIRSHHSRNALRSFPAPIRCIKRRQNAMRDISLPGCRWLSSPATGRTLGKVLSRDTAASHGCDSLDAEMAADTAAPGLSALWKSTGTAPSLYVAEAMDPAITAAESGVRE